MVVWQSRMLYKRASPSTSAGSSTSFWHTSSDPESRPGKLRPCGSYFCCGSHMQYFRHIYSARDNRAEDLRPYVSNLPTSIPVPRGSGDGFGIPNPRGSGSVIGAGRRRSGPSCVLPKGVPQGQTESGGLVLAANAGMTTRGVVLTDLQSSI